MRSQYLEDLDQSECSTPMPERTFRCVTGHHIGQADQRLEDDKVSVEMETSKLVDQQQSQYVSSVDIPSSKVNTGCGLKLVEITIVTRSK